jgi:quinoprotein glucose dehydrogenase
VVRHDDTAQDNNATAARGEADMKRSMACCVTGLLCAVAAGGSSDGDWPNYGRTPGGDRHSPLAQIDRGNVASHEHAWEYRTGEAGLQTGQPTALEATPLVIDGRLYLSTPLGKVIALDPVTGKSLWVRDLQVRRERGFGDWVSRGVSYWSDSKTANPKPCDRRLVVATIDARLVEIDAVLGELCLSFGAGGVVDLVPGLRNQQS